MVQAGHIHLQSPPELSILASCSFPSVLSEAIEASVVEPNHARSADAIPLHSASPPRIGLGAYMGRLLKYCRCSPACLAYAYVYMKRLAAMGGMAVTATSKHRLLLTGTVIAAKLVDDRCFSNNHYAHVGGVSLHELNRMELSMLRMLSYRAQVGAEELAEHLLGITCVPEVAALPFDRPGMPPPSSSCPAPQSTPSAPLDDGPTQEQPRHVRARHCSMDLDTESGLNGLDGFVPAV